MIDFLTHQVTGIVDNMVLDSWRLTPDASQALHNIKAKIQATGVDSMTPTETIWLANLMAERQLADLRNRLTASFG